LPDAAIGALVPTHAAALARVFPTLARVEALTRAPSALPLEALEPLELRGRAFGALRELVARLADEHTVVVSIEDLQWGDEESAKLLLEILRPPAPPPLLLLGTYRTDVGEYGACLQALFAEDRAPSDDAPIERRLAIPPLDDHEAAALARTLLAGTDTPTTLIDALVLEAHGNPLLLTELAHHVRVQHDRRGTDLSLPASSLEDLLRARIHPLPARVRRLLELLAVAAGPVPRKVALAAVGAEADDTLSTWLRAEHLIRTSAGTRGETLEVCHHRIARIALERMTDSDRRTRCAELAAAMASDVDADPETLAALWLQAGDLTRALANVRLAAQRASSALAFGRAARLHRWALELLPPESPERAPILAALADALANTGEPRAAADALIALADSSPPELTDDYHSRAASQLVRGGHADDAYALLDRRLRRLGVRVPATPRRAVLALLGARARLRLRGLHARVRAPAAIPASLLQTIDVCQSLAHGLGNVDPIRAGVFQARALRLALRAGDPHRLSVALATEAAFIESMTLRRAAPRADRVLARAEELAAAVDDPYPRALCSLLGGIMYCLRGEWQRSLTRLETAERSFRELCASAWWEKVTSELYACWALAAMGRFRVLSHRLPAAIRDADERGDQFASTCYRTGYLNLAWLALADVLGAEREAERAMAQWSNRGMHAQHWLDMVARTHLELYRERPGEAIRQLRERWSELRGAYLLRVKNVRVSALDVRARAALAAAIAGEGDREALLVEAERCARALMAEPMALAVALGSLAAAGVAHARGEGHAAVVGLRRAVRQLDDAHMTSYTAGALLELATLTGGAEAEAARRDALARMSQEGIAEPLRFAAVHAPCSALGAQRTLTA
jgi:tetratricopeptide (TPR) repeat protein